MQDLIVERDILMVIISRSVCIMNYTQINVFLSSFLYRQSNITRLSEQQSFEIKLYEPHLKDNWRISKLSIIIH